MKKTNLWSAAFLIAFSLVLLGWVIPNYTSDPQSDLDVRPSFIPNVAAGAILFLACLMLYNSLRRAKAEQEDEIDDEEFDIDEAEDFDDGRYKGHRIRLRALPGADIEVA